MLDMLRYFFEASRKVDKFIYKKHIKSYNAVIVIFIVLLAMVSVSIYINDHLNNDFLLRIALFTLGSYMCLIMPYIFYREGEIRRYILWGDKEKYIDVLKRFTIKSYLVFLFEISYLVVIPLLGFSNLPLIFNIKFINRFALENIIELFYITITLISILWFSYHIVYLTVPLQKIRIKITKYIAIGATLSLIIGNREFRDISILFSCLLISYFWIQYIIELKEEELQALDNKTVTKEHRIT
ncbi:hypothetical protein [Wukongibacter sp. M2B1]|uniref:hypothetical protein n=1 Tax=Wukongibacter sp. M2B1 TaxID=3088895 RepID=UPI003D7AD56C